LSLKRRAPPKGGLAAAPSYVACVTAAIGSAGVQSHASNEFEEFVAHGSGLTSALTGTRVTFFSGKLAMKASTRSKLIGRAEI